MCFSVRVYIEIPAPARIWENRGQLWIGRSENTFNKLLIQKGQQKMKNFKRIISFVMAMVIFASFFCYNVGAAYIGYEFVGPSMIKYFSGTSAFAYVRITDWAEEENTTDLIATTYAFEEDYYERDDYYQTVVHAALTVYLSDGSENYTHDSVGSRSNEVDIEAYAWGSNCLNEDDHYSIVDFESSHRVEIQYWGYNDYDGNYVYYSENEGPIIEIRTFD